MNCPNPKCNNPLRPGAKFCGKCGTEVKASVQPPPPQQVQPVIRQPIPVRPVPASTPVPKFPTGYWAWLGWGIACLLLITTIIFGFKASAAKGVLVSARTALTQPQPGPGGQTPQTPSGTQPAAATQTPSRPIADDFTLPFVSDTGSFLLRTQKGKVVALSFWSYNSTDCDKQVAQLVALQKKYGNQDFTVVGIGMDNPADLKVAAADFKISYPVVAGSRAVMNSFKVDRPPAVVLLDRRMGKVQLFAGYKLEDGQQMEDSVKALLAESK